MWCVTTRSGLVAWGVAWALLGLGACASGASAPGGDAGSDSAPSDSTGADEGLDGRVDAADDAASDVPPDALPDAPLDGADGGIDAPADAADATTAPPALLFGEMALTLLDNLVEHAALPDGDWTHTETGDTVGLAPRALVEYGVLLGRPELVDMALLTGDWYLGVVDEALQQMLAGEDVEMLLMGKAFGGAPAAIEAYRVTGEASYRDFLAERIALIDQIVLADPSVIDPGGALSFYTPLFVGGAIATVNVELAVAIRHVTGEYDGTALELLAAAAELLAVLGKYERPGGYYALKAKHGATASANCNMFMARAALAVATGDPEDRARAMDLAAALEVLWDDERGAYRQRAEEDYVGLAENVVLLYAQLLLHELDAAPERLARVERFFAYARDTLFKTLPEGEGGYAVLLHDNLGQAGPWYWCSGCNFFALHDLLLLNQRLGRAP